MIARDLVNLVTRLPSRRRAALPAMALAAVLLGSPGASLGAEPAGSIDEAEGRSTALLDGVLRDLAAGQDVFLQEIVRTDAGARLAMALGPSTRLRLGERTRIRIEQEIVDQGGELILERGAILFERPDSRRHGQIVVRTPFAIIAARGTSFFIGPSGDAIGVFVRSGVVQVQNRGGTVVLEAGFGTDLTSPDVAPTPPKKWGDGRVAAAMASVH